MFKVIVIKVCLPNLTLSSNQFSLRTTDKNKCGNLQNHITQKALFQFASTQSNNCVEVSKAEESAVMCEDSGTISHL